MCDLSTCIAFDLFGFVERKIGTYIIQMRKGLPCEGSPDCYRTVQRKTHVIAAKCLCNCVLGRMSLGPWKFTETGGLARGLEVCP